MDNIPEGLMQFATPIVEAPVVEESTIVAETPIVEDTVETVIPKVEETVEENEENNDEDYVKQFLDGIGYDGERPKGNTLDDLINAAKTTIDKTKEQVQYYEEVPVLKELAEHIKLGGDPADFFAQPQESNIYQELTLEEDDVENREKLFHIHYQDKLDKEDIDTLIENQKTKGTFTSTSDKILEKLKNEEVSYNENLKVERENERKAAQEQRSTFISEVTKGFTEGLNGITVDKSIVEKAKNLSLPDAKGNFGINEILSKLTPRQEAVVNTFIVSLLDNKEFAFKPTKAVVTGFREKPVHQLFGKESSGGSKDVIRENAGQILHNILQQAKQN